MSNKGIYSAPIEMVIDADIINEVIEQLKPALIAIEEHHERDEDDIYTEIVIGTATVLAGVAVTAGMDIDVLLSIVRQSYYDAVESLTHHDHHEEEPPASNDKKNIN